MAQPTLFIGNLPDDYDDKSLSDFLTDISGVVSVKVIRDKYSDRSRGFALVIMSDAQVLENAIKKLENRKIGTKSLVISLAREPYHQ